jgi:hypothetical protein
MFGGISQPQEMDFSKQYAVDKYRKRAQSKRNEINKTKKNLDREYSDLVDDIRKLRLRKQNKALARSLKRLEGLKKDKKRFKRIAHSMAAPPADMIRQYGVPLLDVLHSVIEAAKTARDYIGEELLKFLLDLFTTLYNIYKNPEWAGVLLNITNFFVRNFQQKHADLALSWFKQAFEVAFAQADGEFSHVEYVLSFFKMSDSFLNDRIWENISDFFTRMMTLYAAGKEMVSVETLDFDTICTKFKEFRDKLPDLSCGGDGV